MKYLRIECNDTVVFNVSDKMYKMRISKIDGNLLKLIGEDGTYRQMPVKNLEDMLENGYAYILK